MASSESAQYPLVDVNFVANAQNEWVALTLRPEPAMPLAAALRTMFGTPDLLTAMAPLDCVLLLDAPPGPESALLSLLPADRVLIGVAARALADARNLEQAVGLAGRGYRVLVDGPLPEGVALPPSLRSVCHDCARAPLPAKRPPALFGPHLAYGVDSAQRFSECETLGFTWFSGDYPLHVLMPAADADVTSRRRLMALLALLARDADTWELEQLLKQDAALSFQLLKLVNSAAFAVNSTPISSFGQAITLLGRRQMQRWLQLLLYARQQANGLPNLLLPLAAVRAAQLEELCRRGGGSREEQDLAFMCGVFSLLDRLFATPMAELVRPLRLPQEVSAALLSRSGPLGQRLRLVEAAPTANALAAEGIDTMTWWYSQLHAYHWAIQVGRNV